MEPSNGGNYITYQLCWGVPARALNLIFLVAVSANAETIGFERCRPCHAAIVKSYQNTAMARTSGPTSDLAIPLPAGQVSSETTHSQFTLTGAAKALRLDIARDSPPLAASRALTYFIGSGRIGRSFLFSDDGYLYQAPVSYYASAGEWRASPGFGRQGFVDLTRAVEPSCLMCHAGGLQQIPGTDNRYSAQQPFLENGISCERCHGPTDRHLAAMKAHSKATAIVNPGKLSPSRRDSICAQCHLTGAARVSRASNQGHTSFVPGDDLAQSVAVYVWAGAKDAGLTVTSHFEKLAWSRCREASGARLWCGTCHDPHGTPVDVRGRCQSCHESKPCKLPMAARRAESDNCQTCHMPKSGVRDVEHAVYSDHSIPKLPNRAPERESARTNTLVPFWAHTLPDPRDQAVALSVAALTEPAVRKEAFERLRAAAATDPKDLAVAAQLAQFYDRMGNSAAALPLLEKVVAAGASTTAQLVNLGTLYAQAGRIQEAKEAWEKALSRNPAQTGARLNLAVAQLREGDRDAARATLRLALHYDPDNPRIAELNSQLH